MTDQKRFITYAKIGFVLGVFWGMAMTWIAPQWSIITAMAVCIGITFLLSFVGGAS